MLGRGLESLIPKKNKPVDQVTNQPSVVLPQRTDSNHVEVWPHVEHVSSPSVVSHAQSVSKNLSEPSEKTFEKPKRHQTESIFQIEVDKIKSNPYQPRKEFNNESLQELAQSIREFGVIQPIIVSKIIKETDVGTDVEYQLIAGERRLMASKMIGLERVPAIVKKVDEHRVKLEIALIENLQRSNLNPLEEAKAYAKLQDEFGLTQREIAVRVGKSREVVANTLRLLNLPFFVQEALREGKINESQARTFLGITSPEEQRRVFENLLANKLSVRALREKVQAAPKPIDPQTEYWQRQIEERLGAPVKVLKSGGGGKIVVQFYSEEEWQGILDKLLEEKDL